MDSEKPSLAAALRALGDEARRELGPHPETERLVAYQAGELPAAEEERLRDHLALCRECTALLLDLADFGAPDEAAGVTDEHVADAWQDLRARLAREAAPSPPPEPVRPAAPVVPFVPPEPDRGYGPPTLPWALAACFLAAAVGLGIWAGSLRRELSQPWANVPIISLTASDDASQRERGAEQGARVPAKADRFVLALVLPASASFSTYEVEILDEADEVVWQGGGLVEGELGGLYLAISRRILPPGSYILRLHGLEGGSRQRVGGFPLEVTAR